MASKGIVAAGVGVGAGLLMMAAYVAAPYAGVHVSPTVLTLTAAVAAFCASISLLTLTALTRPEPKKIPAQRRLSDLSESDYPHFPKRVKIVLRPDTAIDELDVMRDGVSYQSNDVLLTIKKGKGDFNPVYINRLITQLKNCPNFLHIVLVDEHDEFIGYIPAFYARDKMTGPGAEATITKYVNNVLAAPYGESIKLHEIGGLSIEDTIFDHETVAEALKRLSGGFHGFVVFRHKSRRRPVGVIWEDEIVQLNICSC